MLLFVQQQVAYVANTGRHLPTTLFDDGQLIIASLVQPEQNMTQLGTNAVCCRTMALCYGVNPCETSR